VFYTTELGNKPRVISARYFPCSRLSVLRNISLSREDPVGLYLSLNLSKRWNSCREISSCPRKEIPTNLVGVHIERVDGQVICREVERLKNLLQCQILTVTVNNNFLMKVRQDSWLKFKSHIGLPFQFRFDEAEKMLLVHTRRVMNMSVYFSNVIEIPVHMRQITPRRTVTNKLPVGHCLSGHQ